MNNETIGILVGVGALLIAIGTFLLQRLKYHSELKSTIAVNKTKIEDFITNFGGLDKKIDGIYDKLDKRMDKMEIGMSSLETKIEPFWNLIRTDLVGLLHKPTHEEMDALIEKFQRNELNNEEAIELFKLLWKENDGDSSRHIVTLLVTTMLEAEYDIPKEVISNVGFYSENFESNSRREIESERHGLSVGS